MLLVLASNHVGARGEPMGVAAGHGGVAGAVDNDGVRQVFGLDVVQESLKVWL